MGKSINEYPPYTLVWGIKTWYFIGSIFSKLESGEIEDGDTQEKIEKSLRDMGKIPEGKTITIVNL